MATIPRLVVDAVLAGTDGGEGEAQPLDLTAVLAGAVANHGTAHLQVPQAVNIRVAHIVTALPESWRPAAWEGKLQLPGFYPALDAFNAAIGGEPGWRRLHRLLDEVRQAERLRDEAVERGGRVAVARWEGKPSAFEFVFEEHLPNEGYVRPEDVPGDLGFDDYRKLDPQPKGPDPDGGAWRAWGRRFTAWQRRNLQPFAFGTTEVAWPGISAKDIRERQSEREDGDADCVVNVDDMVETSLSDAHDGAVDSVVALGELQQAVEAWAPHAGTGDAVDLGLEDVVTTWNNRQRILTYFPDYTVVTPLFAGVTLAECRRWCAGDIARLEARMAGLANAWEAPDAPAAAFGPAP